MQIFTIGELFNLVVLTLAVGYVLSSYVHRPKIAYDYTSYTRYGIDWEDIKFAMIVAAPAVLIHEMGHKFMAIAFGIPAYFEVWWTGIAIAVILRAVGSPFLILAPGYVVISQANDIQNLLISAAGPLMNLILWLGSDLILKHYHKLSRRQMVGFYLSKKINMILFIFNILPIPPLDGFHVAESIIRIIL